MDTNQTKIVELLREVHVIAIKEIERLNLRIAELENHKPRLNPAPAKAASDNPATTTTDSLPERPEILNEMEVAEFVNMSVATMRRWRLLRTGPKYLKIGSAVRYRRADLEAWLDDCSGLL
jgi:predicted DNA-binding transcriptional regulator AlpA